MRESLDERGDHLHTLYLTPETESAFLKNYTPKRVIEQFESGEPSSFGHHSGGTAGREFFTHQAGFQWHLSTRAEEWITLMIALN